MTVLERIQALLSEHQVPFQVRAHPPVFTSAQAASVRGEALGSGAKALILKVDDGFALFVLPGDRKLDSKRVRAQSGAKGLRFATPEEVSALTGLRAGAIPPFGSLFGLKTYSDRALSENDRISFNAGSHTDSISMRYQDFVRVEQPTVSEFSSAQAQCG